MAGSALLAVLVPVHLGHAGTDVVPGRNGRIVVQVSEPGGNQLYPANLYLFRLGTGGAFIPLTRGDDNNANPSWSPDGRLIAFDSNAKSPTALDHDLFVIRPDASGLKRLTSGPAVDEDPSWSPDGKRIAFTRSVRTGNLDIWVMNANGSAPEQLTTSGLTDEEPAWSPDGAQIAFASFSDGDEEIYVMNADGSEIHQITHNNVYADRHPGWSPDGRRLVFDSNRNGNSEIYTVRADGTGIRLVTTRPGTDARPTWSPDGRWIAFQTQGGTADQRQVAVVDAKGDNVEVLSRSSLWITSPDWQRERSADRCPIRGTVLADNLHLSNGPDVACLLGGNDTVWAGAGNDRIDLGPGNDLVTGGAGVDTITCGPGRDVVHADRLDHVARDCEVVRRSP